MKEPEAYEDVEIDGPRKDEPTKDGPTKDECK
jgi:hypothetical protein